MYGCEGSTFICIVNNLIDVCKEEPSGFGCIGGVTFTVVSFAAVAFCFCASVCVSVVCAASDDVGDDGDELELEDDSSNIPGFSSGR